MSLRKLYDPAFSPADLAEYDPARPASPPVRGPRTISSEAVSDPYDGVWTAEVARSQLARTGSDLTTGLRMFGHSLTGNTDARVEAAKQYLAEQERASVIGPDAQEFDPSKGIGHNVGALGYMATGMVPDMALSIVGGGVGASALRNITRVATGTARASRAAPAIAADARVAAAQAREAAQAQAAAATGRTPRAVTAAGRVGFAGGVTAGSFPGLNASNAERMADPETSWEDAQVLNAGTALAAATQTIPLERLASRFMGSAAQDAGVVGWPSAAQDFVKAASTSMAACRMRTTSRSSLPVRV